MKNELQYLISAVYENTLQPDLKFHNNECELCCKFNK